MNKAKLKHHLNCIKMCESDRAIERRIDSIFAEGVGVGWVESNQCAKCQKSRGHVPTKEEIWCKECLKGLTKEEEELF